MPDKHKQPQTCYVPTNKETEYDVSSIRTAWEDSVEKIENVYLFTTAELEERDAKLKAEWQREQWISVEDRLPEFGENVLVRGEAKGMNPNMGGAYTFICSRKNLKGTLLEKQADRYVEENQFTAQYVTHWMPLPQPPKP